MSVLALRSNATVNNFVEGHFDVILTSLSSSKGKQAARIGLLKKKDSKYCRCQNFKFRSELYYYIKLDVNCDFIQVL